MKKLLVLMLILSCFALCACGAEQNTLDTDMSQESIVYITTPYADLGVPESFDENVVHEVISEVPYTVLFKMATDDTELFTISFNEPGNLLLGTVLGDKENTVVYANLFDLDHTSDQWETYCAYQEVVNIIAQHLAEDYPFARDEVVAGENTEVFDIETDLVTLYYPSKWKDAVSVSFVDGGVKFTNDGTPLFDLMFSACDGYLLGTYGDTPIYVVDYALETDEQCAMQEDVNVILDYLQEDPNFILNG